MSASTSILGSEKKRRFVLDTSALIAMIEAEEGAERVRTVIKKEEVFIPFVAVLELRYITLREQGQAEADTRYALLKQIGTQILWQIDEPTLLIAARLKATHRLSLGDSLIAAYAIGYNAVLLHKDPEYESLRTVLTLETLPYKKRGGDRS